MKYILVLISLLIGSVSFAKGGKGGFSLGGYLGLASTGAQSDINVMIADRNTNVGGGITTGQMNSAIEYAMIGSYRFNGSIVSLQLRPSYFVASEHGTGGGQSYNYDVTAFTVFPTFRFVMLENNIFKFFGNAGVGWAFVSGTVKEAATRIEFSGNAMGVLGGLGAEFCFGGGDHCMIVEGNVRYLPVPRTMVDSSTGATGIHTGATADAEYEINNHDVGVSLSGILGTIGYAVNF